MKDKKGFTLVELLAVVVILSIIVVIATRSVLGTIQKSKEATKDAAIKELIKLAEAYCEESYNCSAGVSYSDLFIAGFIDKNTTNPDTLDKFKDSELNNDAKKFSIDDNGKASYNQ